MSIKLMSAIFDSGLSDLQYGDESDPQKVRASTAKLLLLAIADHCNDEGYAYPGLSKLEKKTALSRQGIINAIDALKENGFLEITGTNDKFHTNIYHIIIERVVNPVDQGSKLGLLEVVNPVDHNHHLTITNPIEKKEIVSKPKPEGKPKKLEQKDYDSAKAFTLKVIETSDKSKTLSYTQMPELYIPYAKAFIESTGIQYLKRYFSDWCGTFEDWISLGYQPDDIKSAVEDLIEEGKGGLVSRPGSVDFKLRSMKVLARQKPKNPYSKFETIE
jgi:hypothetical protein